VIACQALRAAANQVVDLASSEDRMAFSGEVGVGMSGVMIGDIGIRRRTGRPSGRIKGE